MREQRDRQWADLVAKRATPAHVLEIAGTMHFTFGDAPFVAPGELLRKNGGVIRPERGLEVVTALLRAFFDRELGGRGDPLDRVARRYPEVTALR